MMISDYQRIERAINYIDRHMRDQPNLEEIATHVGLSPYHFQRLFRRWAGISPKRFLEYLTVGHAKRLLRQSKNVFDTSCEVGLSSASRLHDQFVSIEAVTPGEYKNNGLGVQIDYGFHPSTFGNVLIAQTKRGICHLSFVDDSAAERELHRIRQKWPHANLRKDARSTALTIKHIFNHDSKEKTPIHLLVHGTNFQVNVWKALLKIPQGSIVTYKQIAENIGQPDAFRAVANAISVNPISYLIPCHRVLRASGDHSGYRWGITRKRAILAWEFQKTLSTHCEN